MKPLAVVFVAVALVVAVGTAIALVASGLGTHSYLNSEQAKRNAELAGGALVCGAFLAAAAIVQLLDRPGTHESRPRR